MDKQPIYRNDISSCTQWRHMPTAENAADLISRGVDVSSIFSSKLWWHGLDWLRQLKDNWPSNPTLPSDIPETRPIKMVLAATITNILVAWIEKKYSNWLPLLRVTALVHRFIFNCR
jgi:hypothetical protein